MTMMISLHFASPPSPTLVSREQSLFLLFPFPVRSLDSESINSTRWLGSDNLGADELIFNPDVASLHTYLGGIYIYLILFFAVFLHFSHLSLLRGWRHSKQNCFCGWRHRFEAPPFLSWRYSHKQSFANPKVPFPFNNDNAILQEWFYFQSLHFPLGLSSLASWLLLRELWTKLMRHVL